MCENVVHGTEHDHENRKNGRMCLQSSTMSEHIEITPEIIEIRHYLHAHPERSFNTRPAPTLRSCCAHTTSKCSTIRSKPAWSD